MDTLSGLANRRAMLAQLDALAERDAEPGETCLIFIDLDGFTAVNDALGHKVGDALIVTMANRLNGYLCADGMLARLGGDEFAAAFWGADACLNAEIFARNALEAIGRPVVMEGVVTQVGASLGCARADLAGLGSTELFRRADVAMYDAKALGGNRIVTYHSDLDASRRRREQLLQEMRHGLHNDEFDLVYQPVVACSDGRVEAVEALIRWPRRPLGALGPDDFIPVAETTELIHELGLFVLEKAISDIGKHASLRLCVNISPAQFRDRDFEAQVARIVTVSGFDPARLEFEITEGYLIDQPERARTAIANLKSMGASVALDDYGTGYTSIYYLRNYQFDRIKIDRSLAGRIDVDPQAQTLVTGAVFIANGLDMRITAEGVESEDQVRLLRLAGCHAMQGYYISAPLTREQLSDLLDAGSQRLSA
jgi:diguanylate cyclase (GGDEF)-like protein